MTSQVTQPVRLTRALATAALCLLAWSCAPVRGDAVAAYTGTAEQISTDASNRLFTNAHAVRSRRRPRHRPSSSRQAPRILLTYTPDRQGLFNQHYSHYMALLAAASLRCDVVFSSRAYSRSLSMTGGWTEHASSVFYNMSHIETHMMRSLGVRVLQRQPDGAPQHCVRNLTTPNPWHYRTPAQLRQEANAVLRSSGSTCSQIMLHLDRVFSSLQSHLYDEAAAVVGALRFHDRWHHAADSVLAALPPGGFNAVHLRIEPDASTWFKNMPFSMDMYWPMYFDAARAARFGPDKLLYVAGGLVEDAQASLLDTFVQRYASAAVTKETATDDPSMAAHPVDQQAIVDYLVMLQADNVVGHPFSTFSMFLRAERVITHKRNAFVMIDAGELMASLNPTQHAQNVACFDIVRTG